MLPRYPMSPHPIHETFTFLTFRLRSPRTHTDTNKPTICLLAIIAYRDRFWEVLCPSDLLLRVGDRIGVPLLTKEVRLIPPKSWWKESVKSSAESCHMDDGVLQLLLKLLQVLLLVLLSVCRIRCCHFKADALLSDPSTFPALSGTTSWNLHHERVIFEKATHWGIKILAYAYRHNEMNLRFVSLIDADVIWFDFENSVKCPWNINLSQGSVNHPMT